MLFLTELLQDSKQDHSMGLPNQSSPLVVLNDPAVESWLPEWPAAPQLGS